MKLKAGDFVHWNSNVSRAVWQVRDVWLDKVTIRLVGGTKDYHAPRRELKKINQRKGAIAMAQAALGVSHE